MPLVTGLHGCAFRDFHSVILLLNITIPRKIVHGIQQLGYLKTCQHTQLNSSYQYRGLSMVSESDDKLRQVEL